VVVLDINLKNKKQRIAAVSNRCKKFKLILKIGAVQNRRKTTKNYKKIKWCT
jgi:hypothetical protein